MTSVPSEIALHIFRFLPLEDSVRVAQVNWYWTHAARLEKRARRWIGAVDVGGAEHLSEERLKRCLEWCPMVETVDLRHCPAFKEREARLKMARFVFRNTPHLKELTFDQVWVQIGTHSWLCNQLPFPQILSMSFNLCISLSYPSVYPLFI